MGDFEEFDPEVRRDLDLRESSMRDRTRTRGAGVYGWRPSKTVGKWKCRNQACQNLCDVTEEAMESWAMFNAELRRRHEAPLDRDSILVCDDCRCAFDRHRVEVLFKRKADAAALIREISADIVPPKREAEIVEQLEKWHHPDVPGLLEAIKQRRQRNGRKPKGDL